jgi:hypothetical protein
VNFFAEVLAFSITGLSLFEKGESALQEVFQDQYKEIVTTFSKHADAIHTLSEELNIDEITIPKSEKTKEKLLSMANMYVGDEWDNPAELMEWLGFFEGAAIIHWQLVLGAGEGLSHEKIKSLSTDAITFHQTLLSTISQLIKTYAQEKVA